MKGRLTLVALALAFTAACSGPSPAPSPATPAPADQSYSVRGEIARLPGSGDSANEIWLRHEAIPDFATDTGEKVGMDAMTMPFGIGPGLDLAGFAPGDKVRFTLEVRWADKAQPARVTALEKLPPETELAFAPTVGK